MKAQFTNKLMSSFLLYVDNTILKVGEVTTSLHPKNFIIFFAIVVLPAPRGPDNPIIFGRIKLLK